MALIIESTIWQDAKNYADAGNVNLAWQTLANAGDSYAQQAYAIIDQPDSLYAKLVQVQWSLHATPEQIAQNFDSVAKQHVTQYLDDILRSGEYRLPSTLQIEESYSRALSDHGLPQLTAVDAMFSLLDYQDTVGNISWASMLEMEPARIVYNSDVWVGETFDPMSEIIATIAEVIVLYGESHGWLDGFGILVGEGRMFVDELGEYTAQIMGDDPQATALSHRLLTAIDPTLASADITTLLDKLSVDPSAFSTNNLAPLEHLLMALGGMLNGTASSDFASRDAVIAAATTLSGSILGDITSRYDVLDLDAQMGDGIATVAAEDSMLGHAYRYALVELLPFTLISEDGLSLPAGMNGSDYALTNFSEQYLTDRAHMLDRVIEGNVLDASVLPIVGDQPEYFYDFASEKQIVTNGFGVFSATPWIDNPDARSNATAYIFGDGTANTFAGGDVSDFLYGGAGGDSITGGAGHDYIEGNAGDDNITGGTGDDILLGGKGSDTYHYTSGDGFDVIRDDGGMGSIVYDGVPLEGGDKVAQNIFEDANGITYVYSGAPTDANSTSSLYIFGDDGGCLFPIMDESSIGCFNLKKAA